MFFDSHAHFSSFPDDESRAEVVKRAIEAGVDRIIAVGGSRDADRAAIAACRQYPDAIGAAIGYDRDQVEDLSIGGDGIASVMEDLNEEIGELCESGIAVAAIGEIGLDFHYSADTSAQQIELLNAQLGLACEREMPVIVHSREAEAETLAALSRHADAWTGDEDRLGVLHCFTGDVAFAERVTDLGFYVSFSGIVTFPNAAEIQEAAKVVPAERLLIETDTPYLAPVPYRGKPNEPAYLPKIVDKLAELRGCSSGDIAKATSDNGMRLFYGA
jgi:TatD DNase family protein